MSPLKSGTGTAARRRNPEIRILAASLIRDSAHRDSGQAITEGTDIPLRRVQVGHIRRHWFVDGVSRLSCTAGLNHRRIASRTS